MNGDGCQAEERERQALDGKKVKPRPISDDAEAMVRIDRQNTESARPGTQQTA